MTHHHKKVRQLKYSLRNSPEVPGNQQEFLLNLDLIGMGFYSELLEAPWKLLEALGSFWKLF